jgi:hypothetical protein
LRGHHLHQRAAGQLVAGHVVGHLNTGSETMHTLTPVLTWQPDGSALELPWRR